MKKVFNKCFIILGVILNIQMVNAQRVALKSNLIDWATLSPNLAVEMRLNQRLTLDISAAANLNNSLTWNRIYDCRYESHAFPFSAGVAVLV